MSREYIQCIEHALLGLIKVNFTKMFTLGILMRRKKNILPPSLDLKFIQKKVFRQVGGVRP
jgi:hypothetical protein